MIPAPLHPPSLLATFRKPQGLLLWLAMLAIAMRGLLPGGVMLEHANGAGLGLKLALCSGGHFKQVTVVDADAPSLQAVGECVYAAAAVPALPSLPITDAPLATHWQPLHVAITAPLTEARPQAPPPARGPPQVS